MCEEGTMTVSTKCRYEVTEKGVALITIHNPPMNALDEETMYALEDLVKKVESDTSARVVVITGEGPTFIVGADVNRVREIRTADEGKKLTSMAQAIVNTLEKSRKPVIAAINGPCFGGGMELAMACHLRFISDQAQMGLPEIMLGIMPGFGGTQRSARLLGTAKALEIMLTGKFIPGQEANDIGLVNGVFAHDDLMKETIRFAEKISSKSQLAVKTIMESVLEGVKKPLEEGLALESECFGRLAESEDKEEGIAAFLEKRKPVFNDR